tara:strand:- start:6125 stop:7462 length:1338 start_codon:yes stop_codon:yes gene_type:complete
VNDLAASPNRERMWIFISLLALLVTALSLRFGTDIRSLGPQFDERYITVPMNDLMENGWSVETAIDYQETKGPALIWPYAVFGKWLGGDLNALRQVSCLFFVLSGIPLLLLALRCGLRNSGLLLAMVGFMLLPYELVFSQLVMGEVSFVFGAVFLFLVVLWGMGGGAGSDPSRSRSHPVAAPVLYGVILTLLLYSRIHAVALAGGVCLAMWSRSGIRSWPWWLASIIAGLLRVPLWIRWGGLVSPDYQNLHGLGLRLESLTYLGAALLPLVGIFLLVFLWRYRWCRWWLLCPLGALLGLVLAMVAMPDLTIPAGEVDLSLRHDRYQGVIATTVLMLGGGGPASSFLLGLACVLGLASLGAFAALAFELDVEDAVGLLARMQLWALVAGCGLYMLTRGFVFDRYLLIWAIGLPVLWCRMLPRWLVTAQYLALLVIAVRLVAVWLIG